MAETQPPYFENDLIPIELTEFTLQVVLGQLKELIHQGITQLNAQIKEIKNGDDVYGTIFNGDLGKAKLNS
jgi:hypothetical protein